MISVQALRAIAALSVVLVHFDYVRAVLQGTADQRTLLYPLASGVDLFFVISGFIMVYSSEKLFGAAGGWRHFLARRVSRIVPLYWIATAAAAWIIAPPSDAQKLLTSLFFIPHRTGDGTFFPVLAGGWTLNFEMFFYCVFAVALFLPRIVAVSVVGAALLAGVIVVRFFPLQSAALYYWSDPIVLEFVFGMAIALLREEFGVRLPAAVRWSLIGAGAIAIWFFGPGGTVPSGDRFLVWGLPVALIVAGTVLGDDVNFGLAAGPIKLLGDSSYSLYLFHPMITTPIIRHYSTGNLTFLPLDGLLLCGLIASISVGITVYLIVERPSIALVRARLASAPSNRTAVAASERT